MLLTISVCIDRAGSLISTHIEIDRGVWFAGHLDIIFILSLHAICVVFCYGKNDLP